MTSRSLLLFEKDLRLQDNPALTAAAERGGLLSLLFVLDEKAKGKWAMGPAQRWWLQQSLQALQSHLDFHGQRLFVEKGDLLSLVPSWVQRLRISHVFWNRSGDPYQDQQRQLLKERLNREGIEVSLFPPNLLMDDTATLLTKMGTHYQVFSQFWNRVKKDFDHLPMPLPVPTLPPPIEKRGSPSWPSLDHFQTKEQQGWQECWNPGEQGAWDRWSDFLQNRLKNYVEGRDRPDLDCTSRLSPHLHFGEISIRSLFFALNEKTSRSKALAAHAEKFLSELGWREFNYYLLDYFPDLPLKNFDARFDEFSWKSHAAFLRSWQQGQTGIPLVDAGMRQLLHEGWMHNRVRMVTASFLTKNLHIHWHEGADWFWDHLVDADLANNSANWQWVAGSGADAAPFFRIFNPVLQGKKFDPEGEYIRRWVPELARLSKKHIHAPWEAPKAELNQAGIALGKEYPCPLVDLHISRKEALALFSKIKRKKER